MRHQARARNLRQRNGSIGPRRTTLEKTFVRCRLVARDVKPKRKGPRDDLCAAMPPLEAKKALFAFVAGMREKRRAQGHDEVKLMFVDVKKAHLNAKCDEEEWVELSDEFSKFGRYAKLKRWLCGMRKAASGWEDEAGGGWVSTWQSSIIDLPPSQDAGASRRAR